MRTWLVLSLLLLPFSARADLARRRLVKFEDAAAKASNLTEFMNLFGENVSADQMAAAQAARNT